MSKPVSNPHSFQLKFNVLLLQFRQFSQIFVTLIFWSSASTFARFRRHKIQPTTIKKSTLDVTIICILILLLLLLFYYHNLFIIIIIFSNKLTQYYHYYFIQDEFTPFISLAIRWASWLIVRSASLTEVVSFQWRPRRGSVNSMTIKLWTNDLLHSLV